VSEAVEIVLPREKLYGILRWLHSTCWTRPQMGEPPDTYARWLAAHRETL
jgi:hypothetical protein